MPVFHSEDEESNSEGDSSDDSDDGRVLKPVFMRKEHRVTVKEQEMQVVREDLKEEERARLGEERKQKSRELVAESIRRHEEEENHVEDADSDAGLPDDTDNLDDLELEAWKVREIARLTRDMEEREEVERDRVDLQRRR